MTTKEGVEKYLNFRKSDVDLGHIVKGSLATVATHLQHFLSFIGKDTKLKELERTDCENYFYHRHKSTNTKVKQVTVQNEQGTINTLMKWLNKNGETHIDSFDFKKLPRLDKGNEAIRRATLTNDEYESLFRAMLRYRAKHNKLDDAEWVALELMLASSASVVALAKKLAKPDTKPVTRTISVPKTKIIKQPVQQTSKTSANDAVRTAIKPISPQKPLSNQQIC